MSTATKNYRLAWMKAYYVALGITFVKSDLVGWPNALFFGLLAWGAIGAGFCLIERVWP